jgi:hypothetical protein
MEILKTAQNHDKSIGCGMQGTEPEPHRDLQLRLRRKIYQKDAAYCRSSSAS